MRQTINVAQAANYLGISRNLAYKLARDGIIPVIKLGTKRLVVPIAALEDLLGRIIPPMQ